MIKIDVFVFFKDEKVHVDFESNHFDVEFAVRIIDAIFFEKGFRSPTLVVLDFDGDMMAELKDLVTGVECQIVGS